MVTGSGAAFSAFGCGGEGAGDGSWVAEPRSDATAVDSAGDCTTDGGTGTGSFGLLGFALAGVTGRFGNVALAGVAGREEDATEGVFSFSFLRTVVVLTSANVPLVDPDRPVRVVVVLTTGRFVGRTGADELEVDGGCVKTVNDVIKGIVTEEIDDVLATGAGNILH